MDERLIKLGQAAPIPEQQDSFTGQSGGLAAAFNATFGARGNAVPQEEQATPQVDAALRTERLTELKGQHDHELAEIRDHHELTYAARELRLRQAREKWSAAIREEAQSVLQRIDEEDARLERELYRSAKPKDQSTELFLSRLRSETTDALVAGEDPVEMYRDAVRYGDKSRARMLEQVAVPWLENTEQRRRFENLVSENEPSWKKKIRAKRAAIAEERRSLELGFSLQGIRV